MHDSDPLRSGFYVYRPQASMPGLGAVLHGLPWGASFQFEIGATHGLADQPSVFNGALGNLGINGPLAGGGAVHVIMRPQPGQATPGSTGLGLPTMPCYHGHGQTVGTARMSYISDVRLGMGLEFNDLTRTGTFVWYQGLYRGYSRDTFPHSLLTNGKMTGLQQFSSPCCRHESTCS